ncbi:GNAT family N-acetyltransferase, partial [Mycobacterium syngnathidarum]
MSVVARVGREVVGVASASEGGREVREWTLDGVHVAPEWRTRNVGRNLLIGLLGSAQRAGAYQLRFTVHHEPILVGLARSIGFYHDQTNIRYSVDLNGAVEPAAG